MGRTGKKYFDEKFKNRIWEEVLSGAREAKDAEGLKKVLKAALVDHELILMEKRLAVKELLKEGIGYREISRRTSVTRATVNFIRAGFKRPTWKKRVYSEDKKESNWRDPLKPRLRPYRFIPKTYKRPLR